MVNIKNQIVAALLTIAASIQGNGLNTMSLFDKILKNLKEGGY